MPFTPPPPEPPPQYEVVPQGPAVRWDFWLSDGPAEVYSSSDHWLGNRFRIGGEAQFLRDYRLILGVTMMDLLTSGESSPEVGAISRYGFDFRVGYFIVPDALFIEYGLYLGDVRGSDIFGWTGTVGQSAGIGWRFFRQEQFSLALEANYLYLASQTVGTFNFANGQTGNATYPGANVYSVDLRVGFDLGGRG